MAKKKKEPKKVRASTGPKATVPTEPTLEAEPELEPEPETLEEQLLAIYEAAAPGPIPVAYLLEKTGVTETQHILCAWDRLYDQHLVPLPRPYKPKPGQVLLES